MLWDGLGFLKPVSWYMRWGLLPKFGGEGVQVREKLVDQAVHDTDV